MRSGYALLVACLGALGCTGSVASPAPAAAGAGPADPGPGPSTTPTGCDAASLLGPRLVRLAGAELQDHVRQALPGLSEELLGGITLPAEHTAPISERVISSASFGAYYAAAKAVAEQYAKSAAELEPCRAATVDDCSANLKAVVTRLYRRAPSDAEWNELFTTLQAVQASQGGEKAAGAALASALLAPQTLYQTERGEGPLAPGAYALSASEALSRARFALTGQAPLPGEVSAVANASGGALQTALAGLSGSWMQSPALVERMLDHVEQRFGLEHLAEVNRTDPAFTPLVQTALAAEFREYVGQSLLADGGSFERLFAGTPARVYPGLEAIYGGGDASLSGSARRKGVLGLASLLTARAGAAGSDPVKRGLLVRMTLLCEAMPPPIAGADFSKVAVTEDMQTRERFETLAAAPTCQTCHLVINPPGYLFEEFDQVGRYRTTEKGRPINARGTITPFFDQPAYPGVGDWDGIVPLADWLSRSPEARSCFSAHFASYVLSESIPQGTANCVLPSLSARFVQSGRLSELVEDLVKSELFLYRTRSAP